MKLLVFVTLFGICLLIYAPAMHGEFIMDDWGYISENPWVTEATSPLRFWTTLSQVDYWPVSYSAFWLLWKLAGTTTWPYHLVNICIHSLNAFVLFQIVSQRARRTAILAALLFLVHPLQVQAVAWIFQLKTLLASLGIGLTCYWYQRRTTWTVVVSYTASLLAKTSGVMLPLILASYEWVHSHITKRPSERRLLLIILAGVAIVGGCVTLWVNANQPEAFGIPPLQPAALSARIGLATRNFAYYVGQAFWPRAMPILQLQESLATPTDWGLGFAIVAIFGICLLHTVRSGTQQEARHAEFAASLGFYFGNLLPALGLVMIPAMRLAPVANHWAYLANAGLFTFVAQAATSSFQHRSRLTRASSWLTLAVILTVLSYQSRKQAESFATEIQTWQTVVAAAPQSAIAYYNLGTAYHKKGMADQSAQAFAAAIGLNPQHKRAHYNLGVYYLGKNDFLASMPYFRRAIELDPAFVFAYHNLAIALERQQNLSGALQTVRAGLAAVPDTDLLRSYLCRFADIQVLTAREAASCSQRPQATIVDP